MNSLTELNGYVSSLSIPYTDERLPEVIFDRSSPTNQSQSGDEGFSLSSTIGINIIDIANAAMSHPTYTINVFNLPGATVTWASLPAGVTLSNPTTGVYTLSGITNKEIWDQVKIATINIPSNYNGIWTYTSSINYYSNGNGNVTKSWTTAVTITDVVFLTTPLSYVYSADSTSTIPNTPQIIDVDSTYPGAIWTIIGTPSSNLSIDNFSSTGIGGTFNVNPITKIFTIVGTRAQVNSRLSGLTLDSSNATVDFIITYSLSNNLNGNTDITVQALNSYGLIFLNNAEIMYFIEDAVSTLITGAPVITDTNHDGLGNYTYTITPTSLLPVVSIGSTGTGGTVTFNNETKVFTIVGTRAQINDRIAHLNMITSVDWGSDFAFTYTLTTPRDESAIKVQSILCGSNDTEVSNMNISRNYYANRANQIFSTNTPYISDFDVHEDITYTITFSSSLGQFAFGNSDIPVNSLSFSGTKAQCNAKFNNVMFYPTAGVYSNGTFTYTQIKNGITQVSQSVGLSGTYAIYNNSRSFIITTSQTWTPSYIDILYGKWDLALVGGGGSGGYSWELANHTAGGGGGGEVLQISDFPMAYQTYNITIGAGGIPVYTPSYGSGSDGGDTTGFGYTARGGKKGLDITTRNQDWARTGGSSGNGNLGGLSRYYYPDGTYSPGTGLDFYYGGGGGGAGEGFDTVITLGELPTSSISGSRFSRHGYVTNQTFSNVSLTGGSGTGAKATVFIQHVNGTLDWDSNCIITITDGGSGYSPTDSLRINVHALLSNYATPDEDIIVSKFAVGGAMPQKAGKKGIYIAWDNSASSMYGWYGGGGSGSDRYNSTPPGTGAIGNLISFSGTQTNGISYSAITNAPSGSGGGGGHIGTNTGSGTNGGSGVIGIRISSKG